MSSIWKSNNSLQYLVFGKTVNTAINHFVLSLKDTVFFPKILNASTLGLYLTILLIKDSTFIALKASDLNPFQFYVFIHSKCRCFAFLSHIAKDSQLGTVSKLGCFIAIPFNRDQLRLGNPLTGICFRKLFGHWKISFK